MLCQVDFLSGLEGFAEARPWTPSFPITQSILSLFQPLRQSSELISLFLLNLFEGATIAVRENGHRRSPRVVIPEAFPLSLSPIEGAKIAEHGGRKVKFCAGQNKYI